MVHNKGFTLIDVLIALSISAIVFGFAIPSFGDLVKKNQTHTAVNHLSRILNYARTLSISTTEVVTICPQQDEYCGKDWSNGFLIFIDKNNNGKREESEQIDRIESLTTSSGKLKWAAFGSRYYLKYRPSGSAYQQNGSFTYCPKNNDPHYAHQIIINHAGRIRLAQDLDKNGVREDSQGKDLMCDF